MGVSAAAARVFAGRDMDEGREMAVGRGRAFVYTAGCPGREGPNQDAAAVLPVNGSRGLLVVADGMGGRPGGADAAAAVLAALEREVERLGDPDVSLRSVVLDGLEEANRRVIGIGGGAATTVAVAELENGSLRSYHVGDSAILVVGQRGRIKLQTVAHSPVGYAVESGLIDEDTALEHAERHLVSNMVGDPDMRIEVGSPLELAPRDTVLLATDGLFDNMHRDEIVEAIRTGSLEEAGRRLAATCLERMREPAAGRPSKPDDLTFILYRQTRGR
ncbi:MAG: serine/threonine protein phosphatase [Deltaproteobacteria bacterium]|nr:MAG: serine/threonine protein phosphatase [Deltaproteobacteria bacterium]